VAAARQPHGAVGRPVAAHHHGSHEIGALGGGEGVGPCDQFLHRAAVERQQPEGVADADRLLGGAHALAHHVDDRQVEVAVWKDQPVVEVASGGGAGIGRHVVHPQLGRLGHHRRRLHRLLQLMDDLALDGLELVQALHGLEVVERHAQVIGERSCRLLVGRSEHPGLGVDEQQRTVRRPVGPENGHCEAAGIGRQLQAL